MNTEIKKNIYKNNQRICEQTVTFNKAEDFQAIANLYFRLSNIETRIAESGSDKDAIEKINQERLDILSDIKKYQEYIDGYDKDET